MQKTVNKHHRVWMVNPKLVQKSHQKPVERRVEKGAIELHIARQKDEISPLPVGGDFDDLKMVIRPHIAASEKDGQETEEKPKG